MSEIAEAEQNQKGQAIQLARRIAELARRRSECVTIDRNALGLEGIGLVDLHIGSYGELNYEDRSTTPRSLKSVELSQLSLTELLYLANELL